MSATMTERYQRHFAIVRKSGRPVTRDALNEIRQIEQMVRDDLKVGVVGFKFDELVLVLENLVQEASALKDRGSSFATDDEAAQEALTEVERIRAWAEGMHKTMTAPAPPLDPAKLEAMVPQPEGPMTPEELSAFMAKHGFMTMEQTREWLEQQPERFP